MNVILFHILLLFEYIVEHGCNYIPKTIDIYKSTSCVIVSVALMSVTSNDLLVLQLM